MTTTLAGLNLAETGQTNESLLKKWPKNSVFVFSHKSGSIDFGAVKIAIKFLDIFTFHGLDPWKQKHVHL